MTLISRLFAAATLVTLASLGFADTFSQAKSIMPKTVNDVQFERIGNGAVLEKVIPAATGLDLQFYFPRAYGNCYVQLPALVDGSTYDGHVVEFQVLSDTSAKFDFAVYSDATLGVTESAAAWQVNMAAKETQKNLYYWSIFEGTKGMQREPAALNEPVRTYNIRPQGNWNKSAIKGFRIYNLKDDLRLVVKGIRLINRRPNYAGLIDQFGQWSDLDWAEKITDAVQLTQNRVNEAAELVTQPKLAKTAGESAWGKSRATGRWRVEQAPSGYWFFVTPAGARYWAMGTQTLLSGAATIIEGRSEMFPGLPSRDSVMAPCYSRKQFAPTGQYMDCYDFFQQNLFLKYGSDYKAKWTQTTNERLDKWGFNLITGHIEDQFYTSGRPYVKYFNTYLFPKRFQTPFTSWFNPVDPFEPSFATYVSDQARSQLSAEIAGTRANCIGVSVDNELSWGYVSPYPNQGHYLWSLPVGALNQGMDKPVKVAMVNFLKTRYKNDIGTLNFAWSSSYANWTALEASNAIGAMRPFSTGMTRDLLKLYADKYFKTVKESLNASGFKGLYMGSRDSVDATPSVIWGVAAKYVDVLSINMYSMKDNLWNEVSITGKPVMISEFGFSSTDRGHAFPNLDITTLSQEERAKRTEEYLMRAASSKNVVGANVWCYTETMPSGRWADHERFNSGIIDIADTPIKPMVEAFQRVARSTASLRRIK